ncbi:HIT family protein [Pseudomonas sp. 22526]|uniref:HIT family protein n=1 Tax=Pseudomonas TaxID=286 RepID=UPI0006A5870C|nr:HIT family protein [Pseudomonas chlororaphis]AZC33224.1 Bis(5'-nucleosyl)-tetraphosphatase (asymmetrical) [Pseudomonas chlororaphis subsp. piscium]MBP5074290.1 HIT family protein [Pseudomonas chlororaphis]QTT87095.1 HIT family protein [Pseudomonas chlororaphis]WDG76173.1 HIT family protein [Pseudomonas chlororaphis]WDG84588.1 HIT family protein [Pseudomonas chlororaphis]
MTCIFCQIAAGELPSALVYRDTHCMAFMDVHPLGQGHVLLIPLAHVEKLEQLPTVIRQHLYQVFDTLLAAQRRAGFGVEGTHLIVNDGKATNQHIPHAHLHLVPRQRGDGLGFGMRMFMHFTGVFGRRTPLQTLRRQALVIAAELDPQALENLAHRTSRLHAEST